MIVRILPALFSLFLLSTCGRIPGIPGGGGAGVNADACGGYASNDVGAKLKEFLEATERFEIIVDEADASMRANCVLMAQELNLSEQGNTAKVCNRVSLGIRDALRSGFKAGAELNVEYVEPVCTVDIDLAATAVAECEGSATADVNVVCEGTCTGTCHGQCDGACDATAGTEGTSGGCNGVCDGTCNGRCSGGCNGNANVDASAECRAKAEISSNAEASCTKPELNITFDAGLVNDEASINQVVVAMKNGLPEILRLSAKMDGPAKAAYNTWSSSARSLAASSKGLYDDLGIQAACVSAQLAGAVALIGSIKASMEIQVNVSVSMSASASTQGSASAGN